MDLSFLIATGLITIFTIPLILSLRNYLYKRKNLSVGWYENYVFVIGLIAVFTIHSMITNSELSALMTIGPFTYLSFMLYKRFWLKR